MISISRLVLIHVTVRNEHVNSWGIVKGERCPDPYLAQSILYVLIFGHYLVLIS